MSVTSPLRRVLGLGAAKEGVAHWWTQRVSAVALVGLGLWLAVALLLLGDYTRAAVTAWMAVPRNAILLSLTLVTSAYHSQLGVQVVIEDYVHHHWIKVVSLLLLNFLHIVLAVVGVFAVLHVALA
jgi:succinate dehydrogenase / fumarate reductase, membrane anchor subunit